MLGWPLPRVFGFGELILLIWYRTQCWFRSTCRNAKSRTSPTSIIGKMDIMLIHFDATVSINCSQVEYVSILPYIRCLGFVKAFIVIQFQRKPPVSGRTRHLCIVMHVIIGIVTAAFTLIFSLTRKLPESYWDLPKRTECRAIWKNNFARPMR